MSVAQTGPIIKELAKQTVDNQASNKGPAKSKGILARLGWIIL